MKVGVLSQWYAPEPGGASVPSVLADGLAAGGHDVRVLTGFPNYPRGSVYPGYRQEWDHVERGGNGVELRRVPLYPSHDGNPARRAGNYLSFAASSRAWADRWLGDRDVLWVYNSPATVAAVAAGLRKRRDVPYLLHVMDVWPDSVLESGMLSSPALRGVAGRLLSSVVARGHDRASLIAVSSPGQVDLLASRGVPREMLRYQPVWADEAVFFPRVQDREFLPLPARTAELVVMYAGAMGSVQRLDTAIRAAHAAAAHGIHLVLVGQGIAEPGLRSLAEELGATNVHFTGPQPPERMGDLAAAADVHLVSLADSPLMRVTMPSKVQAIMASGRAIVATCVGDAANVVEVAHAGVVVSPGDADGLAAALKALADDRAMTSTFGENGRAYYEGHFRMSVASARVDGLLREIAG